MQNDDIVGENSASIISLHDNEHNKEGKSEQLLASRYSPQVWDFAFHGKLYGRSQEKIEIRKSYNTVKNKSNGKTELILISGETGVGKTALARFIRSTVIKDGGYFVSGKFDQLPSQEPYSAFIAGLTEFSRILISRENREIERIQKNVKMHIKTELTVLSNIIPSLREIFGSDTETKTTIIEPTENVWCDPTKSFKYVFRMFMKAISSNEKPVVFLLDDMHWADESSLDLLNNLFMDSSVNEGILYIGTCRDDSSTPDNIQKLLETVQRHDQINYRVIRLQNLKDEEINLMLSETLKIDQEFAISLTNLVHSHTKGNIFFLLEYLHYMFDRKNLFFDEHEKKWKCNILELGVSVDHPQPSMQELIISRQQRVSPACHDILQYAACLGTTFTEIILEHLMSEPVSVCLQCIADCGWVHFDEINRLWKFSHDGIQEAMYDMIPSSDRCRFHYRIGRKLWRALSMDELDQFIFVVVGQLLYGLDRIIKQEERTAVAKLCFRAGERAVNFSNFRSAFHYLSCAISLLSPQSWRYEYEFCLSLHNAAVEVAYCKGDFESVYKLVQEILLNSHLLEDKIQAYATKLYALGSSGCLSEATEIGLAVLKELGEEIPHRPSLLRLSFEARKIKRKLRGKTDQYLLCLPLMHDPKKISAMRILDAISFYVLMIREELVPFIVLRMLTLTLDHGRSAISSVAFTLYGGFLCGLGNDVEEGFRFGRLGLKMYEEFGLKNWIGRVFLNYYGHIHGKKMPFKECVEPLNYAYLVALEKGDVEYAFLNKICSLWISFQTTNLSLQLNEVQGVQKQIREFGQDHSLLLLAPIALTIRDLLDNANVDVKGVCHELLSENEFTNIQKTNKSVSYWFSQCRTCVDYLLGNYDKAYLHAKACMSYLEFLADSGIDQPFCLLFVALVEIEKYRRSDENRCRLPPNVRKILKIIKKFAKHAPSNTMGKMFLVEAEIAAIRKQNLLAIEKYTCAIALSKDSGYMLETALGNERAAKFLIRTGERERAKLYFQEALSWYRQWGAEQKVSQLLMETTSNNFI